MTPQADCPQAHSALTRLQRRLTRRLEQAVGELVGPVSPELKAYERRFRREFSDYQAPADMDALIEKTQTARVVLCGDFHSYPESQRTALKLLQRLAFGKRRWTLCLEMVRQSDQVHLDRYQAGSIGERAFLEAIDYRRNWGFDWSGYRPLFSFARDHGVRLCGINTGPSAKLRSRDKTMARLLTRLAKNNPEQGLFVLVGDLHLAESHLPAALVRQLPEAARPGAVLRILQNNEQIFWKLARQGVELHTEAVRLAPDAYCLISGTPWTKQESYLNWLENGEQLLARSSSGDREGPLYQTDQLLDLAVTVARFLGLGRLTLDGFAAYTRDEGAFASELLHRRPEMKAQLPAILASDVHVLPELDLIYLRNMDIDHLAEAAAEYVHLKSAGTSLQTQLQGTEAFACRALKKALAFSGSMLVNPKRSHELDTPVWPHSGPASQTLALRYARSLLQALEAKELSRTSCRLLDAAADDDCRLGLGVSTALGRAVGAGLFRDYARGRISRKDMRELFRFKAEGPTAWLTLRRLAVNAKQGDRVAGAPSKNQLTRPEVWSPP